MMCNKFHHCTPPPAATAWGIVSSCLRSDEFVAACQATIKADDYTEDSDWDDSTPPCACICPAVRALREKLDESDDRVQAMMHEQDECEHQLDICHALAQSFADECTKLKAEIREGKRILAIKERQLEMLVEINLEPGADGEDPWFII